MSSDVGMFFAFRFITSCAGSAPLTIGGGTVLDVIPQEKRAALAMFAVGPLLGPVIEPVIGDFIAHGIGWRWTFYVLAIFVSSDNLYEQFPLLTIKFVQSEWRYFYFRSSFHVWNLRGCLFEPKSSLSPQRNGKPRFGVQIKPRNDPNSSFQAFARTLTEAYFALPNCPCSLHFLRLYILPHVPALHNVSFGLWGTIRGF